MPAAHTPSTLRTRHERAISRGSCSADPGGRRCWVVPDDQGSRCTRNRCTPVPATGRRRDRSRRHACRNRASRSRIHRRPTRRHHTGEVAPIRSSVRRAGQRQMRVRRPSCQARSLGDSPCMRTGPKRIPMPPYADADAWRLRRRQSCAQMSSDGPAPSQYRHRYIAS